MDENTEWLEQLRKLPKMARDFYHPKNYELVP